jgi:predicted transcriptional regulator
MWNFIPHNPHAMRTAADILRKKPHTFNFVDPGARVSDALNLINALDRSFLVVMKDDAFKGIFCEHDFVKNVAVRGWDPAICIVSEVMHAELPVATLDTHVEEIIGLLNTHHVNYIPVFDGHRFEGIITLHDVMDIALQCKEEIFDLPLKNIANTASL